MVKSERALAIEMTVKKVSALKRQFVSLRSLLSSLSAMGELAIFGGAIRDIVISPNLQRFRDIDIVVSVLSNDELLPVFHNLQFRRTRFGGFHCILEGVCLDVWALGATWAFKEGLLRIDIENLPRSTFLSIDAIAVTLADRKLYEYRFFESIKEKTIDIVLEKNPFPALCVLRSLVLRRKYDFIYSNSLRTYIRDFWNRSKDPLAVLDETQVSHYGERVMSKQQIKQEIEKHVV